MDPEDLVDDEEKGKMANTTAEKIQNHQESTSKFTYYMAGVTMAVLAFSLQAYKKPPAPWVTWLYVVSWGFLLASFIAWVGRLLAIQAILTGEAARAKGHDHKMTLMTPRPLVDAATNQELTVDERAKMIRDAEAMDNAMVQKMETSAFKASNRQSWGLWLLVLGLLLQAVAKSIDVVMEWGVRN